ncbi:ribosome assembly RNA-binding protein YhbY [Herbaspirillum sp.]|uniref:ribosome assembly RNA-binding protein YhbY n=1 Tax=Herbaspirillum sp. TaxID=1890675 RepID=UPI001B029698|nr:ribosome assembly RNA-binding protein YhbY [Herbaspirillum sp.]MBO9537671.1 ribosome assembly RNA-binding protein YhbY [Herbaspirillum sp.]
MLKLTPAERSELRAQAHALNPVVMVGESGLTDAVLKEIDKSLNAHGLIKVRVFGDDREERIAIYDSICEQLKAAQVQHIGKLLVIYRPAKEEAKKAAAGAKGGLREVTIVKSHATKRPSVNKVMLKGNERVTAGGLVKKAKPRQRSTKKSLG